MATRSNPKPEWLADGQRLAQALERAGWTQQQLADKTGARPETISRIIAGKQSFRYECRKQTCAVLGCTMADLDGSDDGNPESKSTRPDDRADRPQPNRPLKAITASILERIRETGDLISELRDALDKISKGDSTKAMLPHLMSLSASASFLCMMCRTMHDMPDTAGIKLAHHIMVAAVTGVVHVATIY